MATKGVDNQGMGVVDEVKLSVFTWFLNGALQSKAWWSAPT